MDKIDERFWYSVVALIATVELAAVRKKRRQGTISYAARKALRCQTPGGRVALYGGWALLTAWLLPHLCSDIETSSS